MVVIEPPVTRTVWIWEPPGVPGFVMNMMVVPSGENYWILPLLPANCADPAAVAITTLAPNIADAVARATGTTGEVVGPTVHGSTSTGPCVTRSGPAWNDRSAGCTAAVVGPRDSALRPVAEPTDAHPTLPVRAGPLRG